MSLKKLAHITGRIADLLGMNPRVGLENLCGLPFYFHDLRKLKRQQRKSSILFPLGNPFPCLRERNTQGGVARGHYFHQDLLVAQLIHQDSPKTHVDVGSRIDGFVAHVASFRPIKLLDIRAIKSDVRNIEFIQCDLMKALPAQLVGCTDSCSCLHALEHFGLGRYGDTVEYEGFITGFNNLHRLLKPQGKLYFSVPIGPQRIEFNAHRVFSMNYLIELIGELYRIDSFSYVDDLGDLFYRVALEENDIGSNFGCRFGCGIFELTKC